MSQVFSRKTGAAQNAEILSPDQNFNNPDMFYAPHTFWFWNKPDEIKKPKHFAEMAKEMSRQGLNPGYIHARHYKAGEPFWLSDDWYTCFSASVEAARDNGTFVTYTMGDPCFPDKYMLPDHPEFPKFEVGGSLPEPHPELKATTLNYNIQTVKAGQSATLPESIFTIACEVNENGKLRSSTLGQIGEGSSFSWTAPASADWRVFSFTTTHDVPSQYKINFLDKRLAEPWLKLENKKYEQLFSADFSKTMKGVFFDLEGFWGYKMAWSEDLAEEYQKQTGADIRLRLPLMIEEDTEGLWPKARRDWFDAVARVYSACVFKPLDQWCQQRNMYSTCHFWEEDLFEQATRVGNFMLMQREFSLPGTDALFKTIHDPRYFKETQSVCEFEGRQMMCEAFGIIGWDVTPNELKAGANSAVAMGITQMVPHGINSNRVLANTSYPPDFYDSNPYWRHFHLWTDFVRRASYVNDHGRLNANVLLFNPLESVSALVGDSFFDTQKKSATVWASAEEIGVTHSNQIEAIEHAYTEAFQDLYRARIETLVADSHYLDQMTATENGTLKYGAFEFTTLILPPLKIIGLKTAKTIVNFTQSGGTVYALGNLPDSSIEHGADNPQLQQLMTDLQTSVGFIKAEGGLKPLIESKSAGLVSCVMVENDGANLIASRRMIGNRDFIWLANNEPTEVSTSLTIATANRYAAIWNCEDGSVTQAASEYLQDNQLHVKLTFNPYEGIWLVLSSEQSAPEAPSLNLNANSNGHPLAINGTWQVSVDKNDQPDQAQHKLAAPEWLIEGTESRPLESWLKWDLKQFSGFVDYSKDVALDQVTGKEILDLGDVKHMAEVRINGQDAGVRLWPPFRFEIGKFLNSGTNRIEIKVGNILLNAVTQYEKHQWRWPKQPSDEDLDAGLFGPVTIS